MRSPAWLALAVLLCACGKAPPPANPQFSDAAAYTFRTFDGSDADLAFALRTLERQTYLGMDVEASDVKDRALTPDHLIPADVADITSPDGVDLGNALPVAVAGTSDFEVPDHARIPLLVDQRPVEPYSPDYYERTFYDDTQDCWLDQSCDELLTFNDLVKKNFLMSVPYDFYKDFRWVDMNLPDPADVPAGEQAVDPVDPRWAFVARSWMIQSAWGDSGKTEIVQSYTIEVWIPRDGQGFVRTGTDQNADGGTWTSDSTGGGTLRMLGSWAQTEFTGINPSDDLVAATTRSGIDNNMAAQDAWLEAHPQ